MTARNGLRKAKEGKTGFTIGKLDVAREFAVLPGVELGRVCGPMRFYNRYTPLAGEKCQSARCGGKRRKVGGGLAVWECWGSVFEQVCFEVFFLAIARP